MIGQPKFKKGDKVSFKLDKDTIKGEIYIVDKYGVYDDNSDVYYDIMGSEEQYKTPTNPKGECLYKHIKETLVKLNYK